MKYSWVVSMSHSFKILGAAAILAVGGVFASAVNAAMIVQNQAFTFGEATATVTVANGNTDSNTNQQTISFGGISRFNTALGTLNSITFDINWSGEVEHSFQQLAPFTGHSTTHASTVTFRADGSTASTSANVGETQTFAPLFGPLGGFGARDISGAGLFTETDASFLALFTGPGSIVSSVDLENFVELSVTAGGPVTASARGCPSGSGSIICGIQSGNLFPLVGGNLEVTYDYTEATVAMSAPGGLALLGLGLIGMGIARRRQR